MQVQQGPFSTLPGPRRKWSTYLIWAEDGLVFMEDRECGEMTVLTCRAVRARLRTWVVGEVEVWDKRRTAAVNGTEKGYCNDMFFKMKRMLDVLEETLQEATNQGDQDDDEVAKKKLTEFMRTKLSGKFETTRLPSLAAYLERGRGVPAPKPRIYTGGY
jgi:hypothetical protein